MPAPEGNRVPNAVWWVPVGALGLALLPMPIGYYTLLRIIVCGSLAYLAYRSYKAKDAEGWILLLGGCAFIFNPIAPIFLGRGLWMLMDIAMIVLLLKHRKSSRVGQS